MRIIGIMEPLGSPRHHSQARLVPLYEPWLAPDRAPIADMHGGCTQGRRHKARTSR